MKKIAFFLFSLCSIASNAGNKYYFSSSGSYNNSGSSSSSPWGNISKIDSLILGAGDTIFFKAGDTLRGSFTISQSGSENNPIVFTSYGNGAKPVISGAKIISGWNTADSVYQVSTTYNVTNFFVNHQEMTLARYPNTGIYLTLDSAQKTYLKDTQLPQSAGYWDSAEVCIHTAQWCWEKTSVQSHSTGKLTYNTPTILKAKDKYSYFLFNKKSMLDAQQEWFNDTVNNILYLYPSGDPNQMNCEITVYSYGIQTTDSASYITISGLTFDKQQHAGVYINSSTNQNIIINNCDFYRQYNFGIQTKGKYHEISNSYFSQVDGHAIDVNNGGVTHIHHNSFKNIGQYRNGGIGGETNLSAIAVNFADSCTIDHNNIDSTGYCGISADGAYNLIERNIVKHAMLLNNDGAPLKSYGAVSQHNIFRNNFVSESTGNTEGTFKADFLTPGIYFDYNTNNCTIENNTIFNQNSKGIFQNSGTNNNTIKGNIVFGAAQSIDLNGNLLMGKPISGDVITKNYFIAFDANDVLMHQVDYTDNFTYGTLDSNYYFQAYDTTNTVLRIEGNTDVYYGFEEYQSLNGLDAHSKQSFVHWNSGTNNYRLFMNQSDNIVTQNLSDSLYLDLDSNEVCGNIQLQPYSSKVLINTLTKCDPSSVKNMETGNFNLYPNPAKLVFFISTSIPSYYYIKNITGQILLNGTCDGKAININALSTGIYLVEVVSEEKTSVKKIVIE